MTLSTRVLATAAFVFLTLTAGNALADKYDYTSMVPEQIEKELRAERKAYRATMDEIHALENGPMDKASAEYKAKLAELLKKAVEQKVNLDVMSEALTAQEKAYGGN